MRHIHQELIEEATEALRFGRTLEEVASRLGVQEEYLAMLISSTCSKSQDDILIGIARVAGALDMYHQI